jgi:hypothetical protein
MEAQALEYYRNNQISIKSITDTQGVLIAAQFQPEASSYAESAFPASHVNIAMWARNRYSGVPLYYKEHPAMLNVIEDDGTYFRPGYFKNINLYITLVSLGYKLIDITAPSSSPPETLHAITLTGTIAIERSLKGLKTTVLGNPYYKGLPGTSDYFPVNDLGSPRKGSVARATQNFLTRIIMASLPNIHGLSNGHTSRLSLSQVSKYHLAINKLFGYLGCI